jgi:hypothetical protein
MDVHHWDELAAFSLPRVFRSRSMNSIELISARVATLELAVPISAAPVAAW